ncbi:DUF1232 domain-containing protein [Brachyspira intermedia]|uniref:YkvA family protein n=1 Tax=uncultured Brachyspira sp. TaxID=221953 RepID=UPI002637D7C2|nr:DUF1232 domain-containing protein [uncultured Brachyspira sp.]
MSDYNNYDDNSNKPAQSGILPWIPLILALIYTVSPVDLVPDVLPVLGWFEDALLLVVGGLNSIQNGVLEANSSLRGINGGVNSWSNRNFNSSSFSYSSFQSSYKLI